MMGMETVQSASVNLRSALAMLTAAFFKFFVTATKTGIIPPKFRGFTFKWHGWGATTGVTAARIGLRIV
jgi:hypothetical protein